MQMAAVHSPNRLGVSVQRAHAIKHIATRADSIHNSGPFEQRTSNESATLRSLQVPIVIPILVLIVAVFLVLAPIVNDPRIEFLYAFLFIVSGLIVYVPFVHYKMYPPFMGTYIGKSNLRGYK